MENGNAPYGIPIGQLGHRPGLHVLVNLEGKTVGDALHEAEEWVPGVIVGMGAHGDSLTIKLDPPIGGQELVSIDDSRRIRPTEPLEQQATDIPDEIVQLARAGKTIQAIKKYRALNGATLDEARAVIAKL